MLETADDIAQLQQLLDESHAAGGQHLTEVIEERWRMSAAEVVERMVGMRLLALATSTADGRPLVGPVDGFFVRGRFHFGSSPTSLRARHIAVRPAVSLTHTPIEEIGVTVHGTASPIAPGDDGWSDLATVCTDKYGEGWEEWAADSAYWVVTPRRMFTFRLDRDLLEPHELDAGA